MTFEEWWKANGIEQATFAEKSAARKGWEAGEKAERAECANLCDQIFAKRDLQGRQKEADGAEFCATSIRKRSNA